MVEPNESRIEHRLDLFLEFCLLAMGVAVRFNGDEFGVRREVYMVGDGPNRGKLGWFAK